MSYICIIRCNFSPLICLARMLWKCFLNLLNHFTELAAGRQGHLFEANGECNLRWCYQLLQAARRRYTATIAALQHKAKTREAILKIKLVISEEHLAHSLFVPGDYLMQIASDGQRQATILSVNSSVGTVSFYIFMHLADAFFQSDYHCIQATHLDFISCITLMH